MNKLIVIAVSALVTACASTSPTANRDESLSKLCATQDLSSTNQRVTLAGGFHALSKNDLACAERLTLDAKNKDPRDAYAWLNLGAVYQRTQRTELAREHYAMAMQLDGGVPAQYGAAQQAQISTREASRGTRPAEIAQYNLGLLQK